MQSERVDLKENAGYNVDMSARPRSERVGMCGRPAQARPRAGAWLGVWLLLVVPSLGWAARPWPDTSRRIVPFADQLPSDLNATQRWFAATHFAVPTDVLLAAADAAVYEAKAHGRNKVVARAA